jgi:hypothetical protein
VTIQSAPEPIRFSLAGRGSLVADLRESKRAIVSPLGDFVFIYGSPLLALGFVHLMLAIPAMVADIELGETTTPMIVLLTSITFAHLLPVFVRSHLNPSIRRAHRFRLLVVPPVLLMALTVWPAAYIVAGVIAGFWDVYHTAQQNFGLGRIYDGRAGVAHDASRRADRIISHALYLGPILAGASLMDHVGELESLDGVGWSVLARTPTNLSSHVVALRVIAIGAMAVAVVWYLGVQRRLVRNGRVPSPHKVTLMITSAVVQILAWGFSSPLVAFGVVNLYHAVQYFALVWRMEGRSSAKYVRIQSPRMTFAFGALVVFLIPVGYGFAVATVVTDSALVNAAFLSVSLLHFWMDGFIWSVRAKTV